MPYVRKAINDLSGVPVCNRFKRVTSQSETVTDAANKAVLVAIDGIEAGPRLDRLDG
jgi:hypothetical protein